MCVSLDVQRILEHIPGIAPDRDLTVNKILNQLQSYITGQRNKALCRCELLGTKHADGKPFSDFYMRLKKLAEEIDLFSCDPLTCADTQTKKPPTTHPTSITSGPCQFYKCQHGQGSATLMRAHVTIAATGDIGPAPPSAPPRTPRATFVARQDTTTSAAE
ncbi:hypothetical protein SK128_011174 [Halocaridina rubra]|uniref:Uncharacterized protein n=1 Tax=Halocaridina rubra TaxID=373956 RepID=A0AAN8XC65_HALRR